MPDSIFQLRDQVMELYEKFTRSFTRIQAQDIQSKLEEEYKAGRFLPEPLIQINPAYELSDSLPELVQRGLLHEDFLDFRDQFPPRLYTHQVEALGLYRSGRSYVVTTGTGSGKSLCFFVPVIDQILREKAANPNQKKTRALVIYPMNALANSQLEELAKLGIDRKSQPIRVARFTGQEDSDERQSIAENPPDILLTNYMMLEYALVRQNATDKRILEHCRGLACLVLDELHTYRGRQGADVALLVRRLKLSLDCPGVICVGTSATMTSMEGEGDHEEAVAQVASTLFGTPVSKDNVVTETLDRVTNPLLSVSRLDTGALRDRVRQAGDAAWRGWNSLAEFRQDPLAVWVECTMSVVYPRGQDTGRLRRAKPMSLREAATKLAEHTNLDPEVCRAALKRFFEVVAHLRDERGRSPMPIKLHQFVSGPGKLMATLEPEGLRVVTLEAQAMAPGRKEVPLFPVYFCRECGVEHYGVLRVAEGFQPRNIEDVGERGTVDEGFLVPKREGQQYAGEEDLPDHWLEEYRNGLRVRREYRPYVPQAVRLDSQGRLVGENDPMGTDYWFLPGRVRLCPSCLKTHESGAKDINKLAGLSGEGRSSATTVITLALLEAMHSSEVIPPVARKVLSFVDNRQDAALQAGHFNDFMDQLLVRGALLAALENHGGRHPSQGLEEAVFQALGFESPAPHVQQEYLATPLPPGSFPLETANRLMRGILGYRLFADLRKGWRFNNPSLEDLGLLEIEYEGLEDWCAQQQTWPEVWQRLSVQDRKRGLKFILDYMVDELCIDTKFLSPRSLEEIWNGQRYLRERWRLESNRFQNTWKTLARPLEKAQRQEGLIPLNTRSGLIRKLKRHLGLSCRSQELVDSVVWILDHARNFVRPLQDPQGWRVDPNCLVWKRASGAGKNPFFTEVYRRVSQELQYHGERYPVFTFESHEHTAQIDAQRRIELERRFRYNENDQAEWRREKGDTVFPLKRLPVLYCSPTMELGVDIAELNTVLMRNVPPTPANYAQRSGRAGRAGQAALVITYCAAQSPHDQWYFQRLSDMVSGEVKAPTLDLTNPELIRAHCHSIWLSRFSDALGGTVVENMQVTPMGAEVRIDLQPHLEERVANPKLLEAAKQLVSAFLRTLPPQALPSPQEDWAEEFVRQARTHFKAAFQRWMSLYTTAYQNMLRSQDRLRDPTLTPEDRDEAVKLHNLANEQLAYLCQSSDQTHRRNYEFDTLRYLASQGFLPGYNFPRLPVLAWIGSGGRNRDEEGRVTLIGRSRYIGITEFGPRSLIYHEGQAYRVKAAKVRVAFAQVGNTLITQTLKRCHVCGHAHPVSGADYLERCERCGAAFEASDRIDGLLEIDAVVTEPAQRITANEEERMRVGYELETTYRLQNPSQTRSVEISHRGNLIARVTYSPAATVYRLNKGWKRRRNPQEVGFWIDPRTGRWVSVAPDEDEMEEDLGGAQRVVPYVQDTRNILILEPLMPLGLGAMATLQAALHRSISTLYQIEEGELAVESLIDENHRLSMLFYESAEGGAGVLVHLVRHPTTLAGLAVQALRLMHYEWEGDPYPEALRDTEASKPEGCVRGCYRCVLSYYNQKDHALVDRRDPRLLEFLCVLARSAVDFGEVKPQDDGEPPSEGWKRVWREWGLPLPEEGAKLLPDGMPTAIGAYPALRTLLFQEEPGEHSRAWAEDRGWSVLVLGQTEAQWRAAAEQLRLQFGEH